MTVAIDMGNTAAGPAATLDLEELLATRLLVQGNSGSGKSHLLRRLMEQSAPWVQQAVIDPEGDFVTLGDKHGHMVIDAAAHTEAGLQRAAERVRQHRVSVVLNLENLDTELQMRHAAAFLGGLFDAERDFWYPMLVVVDEAQLFAPAAAGEVSDEARKVSLGAMTNLMCRGRKRGLAGVIATQRLAKLAKNVAAEASNFLMGRTFLDIDMARAADLLGMERRQAEAFRDLEQGAFIGLGPAIARRPAQMRIGPVETEDRGGAPKLLPLPMALRGENLQSLIFAQGEQWAPPRKSTPAPEAARAILARIEQAPPPDYVAAAPPELSEDEREEAIDDIIGQMLADAQSAFQTAAALHRDFLLRCRIRRLGARPPDLADFSRRLTVIRACAAYPVSADDELWARAVELAQRLPSDLRGVFLLLSRAAAAGRPCPEDGEIARFFGSHSPGRARRMLGQLEQIETIVVRTDFEQNRIIAFPELGCETTANKEGAALTS